MGEDSEKTLQVLQSKKESINNNMTSERTELLNAIGFTWLPKLNI